jgi:ABC-type lipoprotein release transport system permease subunit
LFLRVCTLSAASLLAIAQPLWRATRINPLVALRYE